MRLTPKQMENRLAALRTSRIIVSSRYVELSNCRNCDPQATQEAEEAVIDLDAMIKDLEGKL